MYNEKETLILLQNVGKEGKKGFIPKDTEVTFIKAIDNKNNISKSMIVVQFEDRQLALPELALKPKEDKTIDALKDFNLELMKSNPDLKVYHHNPIMRVYHKIILILYNIFISPIKKISKHLTSTPKSDKKKEDDLVNEIKALMEEKE